MTDLIISSVYGLTGPDLVPFVESLARTTYNGRRIMVAYDTDQDRDTYLAANGWDIARASHAEGVHPFLKRFLDFRNLCSTLPDLRYILACDCRDVVFQLDPSRILPELCPIGNYLCASEGIKMEDDPWATDFFSSNFPVEWESMKGRLSCCAGTIAGGRDIMLELFNNIFRIAITGEQHATKFCDQPAFNLLKNQTSTSGSALMCYSDAPFAVTCGTLMNPAFAEKLTESAPIVDGGIIRTPAGRPYLIVHQYDRFPMLNHAVRARHLHDVRAEPAKTGQYVGLQRVPMFDDHLSDLVKGKSVALVGPSPSLRDCGEEIDSADVVVRMHHGFPAYPEFSEHVGSKTAAYFHCLHTSEQCGGMIPFFDLKESGILLCSPYPRGLDPFHGDVARFLAVNREHQIPYHLINLEWYLDIHRALGTRPNTGIAALLEILYHGPASLKVYGFTFFDDGFADSYKTLDPGTLDQWRDSSFNGNHHQEPQKEMVRELLNTHRNVLSCDQPMTEALSK